MGRLAVPNADPVAGWKRTLRPDWAVGDPAGRPLEPAEMEHVKLNRLHQTEVEIALCRWSGMAFWLIILLWNGYPVGPNAVWLMYLASVTFTAYVQWRLRDPASARSNAWVTMIGDPLLCAGISAVTGGLDSVFITFLYLSALASAFRFGIRETLGILVLTIGLSVSLHYAQPVEARSLSLLFTAVFYNSFAAALGSMFARWARSNLALAEAQSLALQQAHERARALLHRLIDVQEVERKRIADDLHDRMGGRLFTLQQGIDGCRSDAALEPATRSLLASMAEEARACASDVRTLMNELRPTVLDDLGLAETLAEYVAALADVVPLRVSLQVDPELRDWRSEQDTMLFRVVQEAALNVRKHAQASRMDISLSRAGASVVLRVGDNGVGFDPNRVPTGHYGLMTMRERAEALAGGALQVDSAPGSGTVVTVRVPWARPATSAPRGADEPDAAG
jgi:two-component system, NarL family, sensor kinase